jgi:hypothetical protein
MVKVLPEAHQTRMPAIYRMLNHAAPSHFNVDQGLRAEARRALTATPI